MPTAFTASLLCAAMCFLSAADASGQRRRAAPKKEAPAPAPTPESVVLLPAGARQKVDSSLFNPQEPSAKRRRRFEVKVVPAAPPGRSRQDILYTDSIAHRSPRR